MIERAKRIVRVHRGGIVMENVVYLDKQSHSKYNEVHNNCEWDNIGEIFTNAIKRKKLSAIQVDNIVSKIKSEVRGK